jgi:hypothetical protein
MIRCFHLIAFVLSTFLCVAQSPQIIIEQIKLSNANDSMIVTYALTGNSNASNVQLEITNEKGDRIQALAVTGDVGNGIHPGSNKTIVWNMAADLVDVAGMRLSVHVRCNLFVETAIEKQKIWIPWWYIAAGAATATGIYAHIKTNRLYNNEYLPSWGTNEAELLNNKVRNWEAIRNIAFGTASLFGSIGVVVHIKHCQKIHALALNYYPQPNGAEFGLTYNF